MPNSTNRTSPDSPGELMASPVNEEAVLSADQQERFRQLVRTWRKETAHLSSASQMAEHPAYREIVQMGQPVVPLLLAELRRKPDHWFIALEEITGANPVAAESEGRVKKMAQAWIRWGEEGGRLK